MISKVPQTSHDAAQVRPADPRRRQIVRNVTIYVVGVMVLSTVGGMILAGGADVGALVFVSGPLMMAVLLRTFGRDGWSDAGVRVGAVRWYALAVLLFPITFALILGGGYLTGSIAFDGTVGMLLVAAARELPARLVFAGFEEWGWRGYLEPRVAALGVPDLKRHLVVGVIWAIWHVPYILNTSGYTELPPLVFVPLLLASVIAMAVVYGQLRRVSDSVWPVVVAHAVGNAFAFPLALGGFAHAGHPALLATRPESLLFIAIWAGIGWVMIRRTTAGRTLPQSPAEGPR